MTDDALPLPQQHERERHTDDDDYVPDPRRWRILGVTLVVGFMSLLDVSIVNVAIPSMQSGLGTTAGTIQWVVSGYALTFGLTLVAGGRLGDAYGRRRLMLIGLVGFILSSAAVGLAPSAALVVIARLVQGATAGLLTPQNSGLIQQLFRGAERGRAFGLFGFTVSVSSAAGPVIGGLIIGLAGEQNGWRYLFLINVPIGIAGMVAVARLLPRKVLTGAVDTSIDVLGAILLGGVVLCLLYPVVSVEGGHSLTLLVLLGVPLFAMAFLRWERRLTRTGHAPLLDLALLRGLPGYLNGLGVGALYFTGFTGLVLVLSVYLQEGLGLSPLSAGLLVTPFAAGSAVSAALAGRVVTTIGRRLTVGALVVIIVGVTLVAVLAPGHPAASLWVVLVPTLLIAGIGGGAVVSPNITLTLAAVPPVMGGAVGGALQTSQRIGASIGAALLMTVYQLVSHRVSPEQGLRAALVTGVVVLLLALLMAIRALRQQGEMATA
ncbi:MFS transporter [Lapillicoccus sp.]|uniref:MFS transporter n=1 Tax=Lapillicoccus sp. TaxID=1909287 RepID=UPI0025FD1BB9|nr:MFS transporter [Lapillicoccus sp.]